ncbi:MAG: biopolymer transporter ExbD, partial [Pyrinomonadaceae bacterium]
AINKETKGITLNNENFGDVSDTEKLRSKLAEIFKERENNGVFREGTNEVEKTIFLKSPKSVRYGDVVKVIDAAKAAGASPIGLQVDDLTE